MWNNSCNICKCVGLYKFSCIEMFVKGETTKVWGSIWSLFFASSFSENIGILTVYLLPGK